MYLLTLLTAPIFVHTMVVFVRLYYFEKHFKDISKRSKLQSKYRRTLSRSVTAAANGNNKLMGKNRGFLKRLFSKNPKKPSPNYVTDPIALVNVSRNQNNNRYQDNVDIEAEGNLSSSSSSSSSSVSTVEFQPTEITGQLPQHNNNNSNNNNGKMVKPPSERDIRFAANLPQPSKLPPRQDSVEPVDIVRSIIFLQNTRRDAVLKEEKAGPALVIRGLKDVDDDENNNNNNDNNPQTLKPVSSIHEIDNDKQNKKKDKPKLKERAKSFDYATKISPSLTFENLLLKSSHHHPKNKPLRATFEECGTVEEDDDDGDDDDETTPNLRLQRRMSSNYVSFDPKVEGNSVFVGLNDEQKDELGGVEYRALKLLAKILVIYYVGWHIFAVIILTPWILHSKHHAAYIESGGVNKVWWAIFTANSSMSNLGLTLTPDSMISFVESTYILIFVPIFMLFGNTAFPVLLRFIIWVMYKLTDPFGRMNESLGFLLDHPRRCFTLLFPSGPTWWLFGIVVLLNVIDTVLFLILDLGSVAVTMIPIGYRILAGFFQAVATRTTGFGILDLTALHPAVVVSYTIMMYINIFPIAMSIRHTNVYEERTLGLYKAPTADDNIVSRKMSGVATHLMRQITYDLWFVFIALFILCITEGGKITREVKSIPIFNILFETTSAYGTVGLSMGFPGTATSLSAQFSVLGKLLIIFLLYKGRHRALPYAIDRAIILPSKKLERNDMEQEQTIRRINSAPDGRPLLDRRSHSLFTTRDFSKSS